MAATEAKEEEYVHLSFQDETKIRALQTLIEALTGKKIRFVIPRLKKGQVMDEQNLAKLRSLSVGQSGSWGLEYQKRRFEDRYCGSIDCNESIYSKRIAKLVSALTVSNAPFLNFLYH